MYDVISDTAHPIKMWTRGVPVEREAEQQLRNIASLPFIYKHVAVMPDVHLGKGATVGSVIATKGAIVPAAVGVDIGCGMMAARTTLTASDLPDTLIALRSEIEAAVPVGMASHKELPRSVEAVWRSYLFQHYWQIERKFPKIVGKMPAVNQIGTLGGGNHFIEVCLDEDDVVWVMLHSGSRGIGNRIGTYFIAEARREMERLFIQLPDRDLAYISEGSSLFDDYVEALSWAQDYAAENRKAMMSAVIKALRLHLPQIALTETLVNCHHNYVEREHHFGENVWVTRKGAVRAREGDFGIIPGSMGTRSYIVRGRGNVESFHSCSHGAGRVMSRSEAKRRFTLDDHVVATAGIECRKDEGVIDETPGAYKPIEAVIAAQEDLIEVVHELRQVLCVKG
jgi:tRNA-splicing ligase RtcB